MKVSLIMSSFKRSKLLDLGLWSLAKQFLNYNLEIIVVNDGMEDNTKTICDKYRTDYVDIKYIFTGQRNINGVKFRSPSIALNIGIKQSTGDIIILTCPEIFHLNDTINLIVESLLINKKIIATHNYMYFDNTSKLTNLLKQNPVNFFTKNLAELLLEHDTNRCLYSKRLPFCLGVYKQEFLDIGGYDEDFTGWGADDDDLVNRLQLNGLTYKYTEAKIIHLYHGKQYDRGNKNNKEYQHNLKLFQERKNKIIRNENREWGVL